MKKNIFFAIFLFFSSFAWTQEQNPNENLQEEISIEDSQAENSQNPSENSKIQKRPKKIDAQKIAELDINDSEGKREKAAETFRFGLENELISLIEDLLKNDDERFNEELFDLFFETKSVTIREKILNWFSKEKDPCLEDFAFEILSDPYEYKKSTVSAVFRYVRDAKINSVCDLVVSLLKTEDENYFSDCILTLGEIGGANEAQFLSEYLEREDLTTGQRQQLASVLGKIKAESTFEKLCEMAQNEDENVFVRISSARAIGEMQNPNAIAILENLFEESDPKIRESAVQGLSFFEDEKAQKVILQAMRDSYYKVRLAAIDAIKEKKIYAGMDFLIFRAKNDSENVVKNASLNAIAILNNQTGNNFLISLLNDQKSNDGTKAKAAEALLKHTNEGKTQIAELANQVAIDDKRKSLRYELGKQIAKYCNAQDLQFQQTCSLYIASKDSLTQGVGLDIYAKCRFPEIRAQVEALSQSAEKSNRKNANAEKATRILKNIQKLQQ